MIAVVRQAFKTTLTRIMGPEVFVWRLPSNCTSEASLTFDDGPDPIHTPLVLDILARHDVKAAFFLTGENVRKYPRIARDIVEAGHGVGGHTFFHRDITLMTCAELSEDIEITRSLIRDATGVDSRLFRPPKGRFNLENLRLTGALGYTMVHWSVTYSDYMQEGFGPLLERYRKRLIQPRDIVLLHDNNRYTLEVLSIVLEGIVGTSSPSFVSIPQEWKKK